MASAQVLNNGFVLMDVAFSTTSGRRFQTSGAGEIDLNMNFQFYAGGLDPNTTTQVKLVSMNQINGDRDADTLVLSDRFLSVNEIWSGDTNAQGDLSLVSFLNNSSRQLWSPNVGRSRVYDPYEPTSYEWSESRPPQDALLDGDYWVERAKSFSDTGQTTVVDKVGVDTRALCHTYESELLFEVSQGGILKSTTKATLVTVICTDLDNPSTSTPFGTTIDLTVYLDGMNQTISPSSLTTSIERAIIPYNKTTEREVVHLDYRIKSTD